MNDPSEMARGEASLESVLSTGELSARPSRPPDYEMENRALLAIAQHMADSPQTTLQKLAEVALEVCQAGSAGVSLVSEENGNFYWPAIAGAWKSQIGGGTPRHFGPCGVVLDRKAVQLFTRPERYYPYLSPVSPPIEEALLTPFFVEGKAVGTVWVVAHDTARKFDAEDMRLIERLGRFAAAAYPLSAALEAQEQQSQSMRDINKALMISSVRQHELTEQAQKAEAALRESEEKYRTLFETMDEGFCIIEKVAGGTAGRIDFRYILANPAFETQSGIGGVVGKTIRQAFPGEPEEWFLTYDAVLETGEPIRFERGLVTQGRVLELYAFPAKGEAGCRVAVIFKDITEQKRSEEALRLSEERYRTLFESAPVGVFLCDSSAVIQDYNRRAEQFWGRAPKRGDPNERYSGSFQLYLPDGALLPYAESPIVEVLRTGIPARNVEGFIKRPDGSRIPVLVNFFPLKNELGEITGAITSFDDITELKRTQDALRSANLDLQQFAHAISHDLQESLRMVMIYTKMLSTHYRGKLDPQADRFLDYATRGAQRMESMLCDLREYLSVNEEHERHPIPIDCNDVLDKALRLLDMTIQESNGVVTHDSLPTVVADEVPLVLLFQNLIGNALKYHRPEGPPRVHISAQRTENASTFSVSDNGIGIKTEYLEQIFTPFKRLHGAEYPGNGIGLATCQKIVARYGGRIWVESTYGEGSTFCFTIPT